MPTDFRCWSQENLANLAADQQATIITLNNQDCARLQMIRDLCEEYALLVDLYCKIPGCKVNVSNPVYVRAMGMLK